MAVLPLADLKKYLRYEASDTSNDDPLTLIVDAAQRYVENYTGHILVARQMVETPARFPVARVTGEVPYFDLRWKPYVADSLDIAYLDAAYTEAEFVDFTLYQVSGATRIIPTLEWPGEYLGITFTYNAGYANLAAVPDDLVHALAVYVANYDESRGALEGAAQMALDELLSPYRLPVLA